MSPSRKRNTPSRTVCTLERIVSGGQTGVDRGALDAALDRGFSVGGWIPKGRKSEDGAVPARYTGLREAPRASYLWRTDQNVVDSDATLILAPNPGHLTGGTKKTFLFAERHGKPVRIVRPDPPFADIPETAAWLKKHAVRVLNVAGPRESGHPGIGELARRHVGALLDCIRQ